MLPLHIDKQLREALFSCHQKGFDISLAWIPSHSGISGNETADSCAKSASEVGSHTYFYNFSHDMTALAKKSMFASWSKLWAASKTVKGKYYGAIQPDIPNVPWFFRFRQADRKITSIICRLRLGHACTPLHLTKLRIKDNSICKCGLDEGTTDHIVFGCPKLRYSLYEILPYEVHHPTNIKCLLMLVWNSFIKRLCMLKIHIQFGGGAELLFDKVKKREVQLPVLQKYFPDCHNEKWTIRELLVWIKDNLLRERPELFLQGDSVRPGILVLVNDSDWELCGELSYELQENDTIMFISTLHGG